MITAETGAVPGEEPDRATSATGSTPPSECSDGGAGHRQGRQGGRHRRTDRTTWVCVAERVLRCWPTTLRAALLIIIVFSGVIALLVVGVGAAPAACVAVFSVLARVLVSRAVRRRLA